MRESLNQFTCQQTPGGVHWWPAGKLALTVRAGEILLSLGTAAGRDVETLKQSPRRSVLRVREAFPGAASVIVKGFPLKEIEPRLRYRQHGLSEFRNYQQAAALKIPTPICHGYFEIRSPALDPANGVIVEDLNGWRSLAEIVKSAPSGRIEVLTAAIPLLKMLYETGTNHIDATPRKILQSPDGASVRLIDWQNCSFVPPRNDTQLLFHAAHFLRHAGLASDSATAREWLRRLVSACKPAMPDERFCSIVDSLQSQEKITGSERLHLRVGTFTTEAVASGSLPRQSARRHAGQGPTLEVNAGAPVDLVHYYAFILEAMSRFGREGTHLKAHRTFPLFRKLSPVGRILAGVAGKMKALSLRETPFSILEFGVFRGRSIRKLSKLFPEAAIYGFDTFTGFPKDGRSDWTKDFSIPTPPSPPRNVEFVAGRFEDTLAPFLQRTTLAPIRLIHIDCDLFSSTNTILSTLAGQIVPGKTVLIFDELLNYNRFTENELLALYVFLQKRNLDFEWFLTIGDVYPFEKTCAGQEPGFMADFRNLCCYQNAAIILKPATDTASRIASFVPKADVLAQQKKLQQPLVAKF